MIDRDVIGEPRAPERPGERPSRIAERLFEELPRIGLRIERPEAVDDPDPETRPQVPAVAPAPRAVLGPIAAETRDVVAPVIVDDEEAAVRTKDPIGLGEPVRTWRPKRAPVAEDDVDALRRLGRETVGRRGDDLRSALDQLRRADPAGWVDDEHVATGDGPERFEGATDLPLPIERERESGGQTVGEVEGKICHETASIRAGLRHPASVPVAGDADRRGRIAPMDSSPTPARMPVGVRVFLGYALAILALIGLSLRFVIDQAISAPVSPIGVVIMALLAYTIFTTTLVLQRKEASRGLALGLSTLTIPAIPLAWLTFAGGPFGVGITAVVALFAGGLFRGLTRPSVRAWLNEP